MDFFKALTADHRAFVERQPVFFVATAAAGARISLSPKGLDTLRILDDRTVAYLDLGGSGNETHAHLIADGRITLMVCAFENPALILRLYGRGRAVLPQDTGFDALYARFAPMPGVRQVFVIDIDSIQSSCGWGVPRMTLDAPRATLVKYHANRSDEQQLAEAAELTASIDGLPVRVQTRVPPR